MGLTASQARDVPAELTVDRVAAALQDLQQHLEHFQKDLVICAQYTQKSCLAAGLLNKHSAKARRGVNPCRGVGSLAWGGRRLTITSTSTVQLPSATWAISALCLLPAVALTGDSAPFTYSRMMQGRRYRPWSWSWAWGRLRWKVSKPAIRSCRYSWMKVRQVQLLLSHLLPHPVLPVGISDPF